MADEENGAAVAVAEDTTAADTAAPDPKVESEAREMGWRPKDQFKGKAEDWRPADEFVKRGREMLPIVNAENKKLRDQLKALEKSTADTISRVEKMSAAALKAQRAQIETQYDTQIERAAEAGDVKAVKSATAAQRTALKAFDDEAKPDDKPKTKAKDGEGSPLNAKDQETFNDWMDENPWFNTDQVLRAAANVEWDVVEKEMPAASLATKLAAVAERLAEEYPKKFGKKAAGKVEGAGDRGGGGGGADGGDLWSKLPAVVRPTADRLIKSEGLFLGKGEDKANLTPTQLKAARERYANEYLA